jgi:hypothetical protein
MTHDQRLTLTGIDRPQPAPVVGHGHVLGMIHTVKYPITPLDRVFIPGA